MSATTATLAGAYDAGYRAATDDARKRVLAVVATAIADVERGIRTG